jgi:hypothetical protein
LLRQRERQSYHARILLVTLSGFGRVKKAAPRRKEQKSVGSPCAFDERKEIGIRMAARDVRNGNSGESGGVPAASLRRRSIGLGD